MTRMTTQRVLAVVVSVLVLSPTGTAQTDQWPKFRGANAGAVPDDPSLPDTWSETENVVWKTSIPGLGWSSPVVWGDHIFITSAVSAGEEEMPVTGLYDEHDHIPAAAVNRFVVQDLDFNTGRLRWERELRSEHPQMLRHIKNSYASETVVTDGERVYVYFGSIGLVAALDMEGQIVWTRDIGAFNTQVELGTGASPVLHEDRLIIVNDNTTRSFMTAFDTATGERIWETERSERGNWSTPVIWENRVRTEIVTAGTGKVRSYDLDGNLLWEIEGMSALTIPSPVVAHGLVYISSGYPGGSLRPVYAIHPGASGDISVWSPDERNWDTRFPGNRGSSEYVAWSYPLLGTYNTSPLVYRGQYYTLLDRGLLLSHDALTGREVYSRQRIRPGTTFTASPWAYNGMVFLLSEDGETFVVEAGPEFKILHTNMLDEMALATPAVVRGSVIMRTQHSLYRIAEDGL